MRFKRVLEVVFLVSLIVYGFVFFFIANLHSDQEGRIILQKPGLDIDVARPGTKETIPVRARPFEIVKKAKAPLEPLNQAPLAIRTDWVNGIVEGNIQEQLQASKNRLCELSNVLPDWVKSYMAWHQQQKSTITPENWKSFQYYLIECTPGYNHCGGTADRLGPIPFHMAVANQTRRLLLIHWTTPTPLESFLMPPQGGLDWRVPDWLWEKLSNQPAMVGLHEERILLLAARRTRLARIKFQSHNHGSGYYERVRKPNEPTFAQVYHDLWRVLFTPVPRIAQLVEQQMGSLGLVPGQYVSVHLRALYAVLERPADLLLYWAQNAVRCATSRLELPPLQQNKPLPILFASDSTYSTQQAKLYGQASGIQVVARQHVGRPLHLEKANSTNPHDFDDTFVDMYMMGMSACVAYGMGGYGRWASQIGYNSSCTFFMTAQMPTCELHRQAVAAATFLDPSPASPQLLSRPLFFPPMENVNAVGVISIIAEPPPKEEYGPMSLAVLVNRTKVAPKRPPRKKQSYTHSDLYIPVFNDTDLWRDSESLPPWMKEYFDWHKKQRAMYVNRQNWTSLRYLVMQCLDTSDKCGGTSDRLKPMLTLLRVAHVTKRLLVIQWSRPAKLEEFLMPPKGGINWRVPKWLGKQLKDRGVWAVPGLDVRTLAFGNNDTVRSRYQSFNGGADWYNEQLTKGEIPFDELYHEVWKIFFTPSPPVAQAIQSEMDDLGLVPGEYSSAHVRALYAIKYRAAGLVKRWTTNGINCATTLRPGRPVFLASDTGFASTVAGAYGEFKHAHIVSHMSNPNPPLHLDKSEEGVKRPSSDYYDTFIDLYILAFGGCVAYNKGGFGNWGLLIGGNTSCGWKMKRGKQGIQNPCNWTHVPDGYRPASKLNEPLFLEPMV